MRLNKDQYVKSTWDKGYSYVNGISDGSIVSNVWIKAAVQRFKDDIERDDLDFREEEVEKAFRFFSVLNIDRKKTQFSFMAFQAFFIMNVFGLYYKGTNRRKYQYALLFMGRRNGKTFFISALNIYFLMTVPNPQCLVVAANPVARSHASRAASEIVYQTPALDKRLLAQGPQKSKNTILFKDKKRSGFFQSVVSDANKLDGFSISSAVLDEVHQYTDDALFNIVKTGIGNRFNNDENPLVTLISTAGFRPDGFLAKLIEVGKKVVTGKLKDDNFFYLIYTLDDDDINDFDNEEIWIKANPALGILINKDLIKSEWQQVKNLPTLMNKFVTKTFNVFVNAVTTWISPSIYKKVCFNADPKEYEHLTGFIGLDLSATRDLSSLVIVFYDPIKDFFYVIPYFWRAQNEDKIFRVGGQDLTEWIDDGYLIESNKKTIDYNQIFEKIKELNNKYYIGSIVFDRYLSNLLIPRTYDLNRSDGSSINIEPFAQTAYKYALPMTFLEKSIYDGTCSLSDNPVLQWNLNNLVIDNDNVNGNIRPSKNKSLDSIDGVVATAMGFHGVLEWYDMGVDEYE